MSTVSGQYLGDPVAEIPAGTETVTLTDIPSGTTLYWVATAYDTEGLESEYSNEVSGNVPSDPTCLEMVNDCPGDFDCDGDVDGSDLSIFSADFGRTDCLIEE